MIRKEELSRKINNSGKFTKFPRQRLNIIQHKSDKEPESLFNVKIVITKKLNMADLVHKICRKKTFFIFITLICIGCLIAAIIAASTIKVNKDSSLCGNSDTSIPCGNETFYRQYGTKTDYIIGRGPVSDEETTPPNHPDCSPMQLFLISRHAIRYPDKDDIFDMQTILPDLRDQILAAAENNSISLCDNTINELKNWVHTMKEADDNRISDTGKLQSEEFGQRLKKKFPSLFSVPYSDSQYKFGYTNKNRTLETANAFAKGVFGDSTDLIESKIYDVLSFHKDCEKILKKKGWNKSKPAEELLFIDSDVMKLTLEDIGKRLQINATLINAKLMLRTCEFEFSIYGSSPWCALFSESNLKVFQYLEDLNDYYNDGYGNKINYEQACPLLAELINHFRLIKQGKETKAMLLFSHAGAVKKVAAHLSLFKDNAHLKADKYCENLNRKWKSSQVCPFNANVFMVLYNCTQDNYRVETFYNEKLVKLEGCSSEFCPWEEFENRLNSTSNCDLSEICTIN